MHTQARRDDIQVLRAIAMLAVILYHLQVAGFSGGFVGVDIFFVISGYLITGKILRDVQAGRFSFLEFSRGRARRLLPALLAMVAVSFAAGAMLFSPVDFQRQSISTITALLGVSDIGFWLDSGYFDAAAILKPLLHTWSLAVEIQFYILWPLVVMFVIRRAPVAALAILTFIGFIAAVAVANVDQTTAFFLTPFRVWEFSIGGLVYAMEKRAPQNKALANGAYIVGAAMILYPIFAYSDLTPFPGKTALLPALGTAVMILFGRSAIGKLVSIRPAVFLGEISYSAYLVHWPLVVFTQYMLLRDLVWTDKAALLLAATVLSVCLYYLVEQPFRKPGRARFAYSATLYVALASAVILPAYSSFGGDGWSWRMTDDLRKINEVKLPKMEDYIWAEHKALRQPEFDQSAKVKVLVIGDSMSADLVNMLTSAYGKDDLSIRTIEILQFCAAIYVPPEKADNFWTVENNFTAKSPNAIDGCKADQERIFSSPLLASADVVLVANYWHPWALPYFKDTKEHFGKLAHGPVYFLGRKDLLRSSLKFLNEYKYVTGVEHYAAQFRDPETDMINTAMKSAFGDHFIDLESMVCPSSTNCLVLDQDKRPIFWDKAHLTPYGVQVMGKLFMQKYGGILKPHTTEISSVNGGKHL